MADNVPVDKPENPDDPVECIALREWVRVRSDKTKFRKKRWAEIGEEVLARKTLWLTAAKVLRQALPNVNVHNLAATDVFVEKAQKVITLRARIYLWIGGGIAIAAVVGIILLCRYLYVHMGENIPEKDQLDALTFTIIIVRMTTVGALIGGVSYFIIGIARAFLHEGTALYERRHALRFGRLYVYLTGGTVKFEELEKAFNWNKEIHTAFKDIRAEKATKSIAQLIAELGIETIKTSAEAMKASKKGNKD